MSEDQQSGPWVSTNAVAWVLDDAPVSSDLAITLLAVARRAGVDGRGARPLATTIAANTGKSLEQVRRDLAKLRELGLLVLGDQSLVAHLLPGHRPVVYDIPMHVKGPKPSKASRNKSGKKKVEIEPTPSLEATPSTHARSTPSMEARSTPSTHARQKKTLNKTLKKTKDLSLRADDDPTAAAGHADSRERDSFASQQQPEDQKLTLPERLVYGCGITDPAAIPLVVAAVIRDNKIKGDGWWLAAKNNGTLGARVNEAAAGIRARAADAERRRIQDQQRRAVVEARTEQLRQRDAAGEPPRARGPAVTVHHSADGWRPADQPDAEPYPCRRYSCGRPTPWKVVTDGRNSYYCRTHVEDNLTPEVYEGMADEILDLLEATNPAKAAPAAGGHTPFTAAGRNYHEGDL